MAAAYSNLGLTYVSYTSLRTMGGADRRLPRTRPGVLDESAVMASV